MSGGSTAACFICRKHEARGPLLPGGPVAEDDLVLVSHVVTPDALQPGAMRGPGTGFRGLPAEAGRALSHYSAPGRSRPSPSQGRLGPRPQALLKLAGGPRSPASLRH